MPRSCTRRGLISWGTAGAVGMALPLGIPGVDEAEARANTNQLRRRFESAAGTHDVPQELLLAMGYVNTRLRMPDPTAVAFRMGDPEARGAYGVMALVRNPWEDTLGLAAELTGLSPETLVSDLAANLQGGAAVLAHSQGPSRPAHARGWLGAVAGDGGHGPDVRACAGVGAGDDYAAQVATVLSNGFSERLTSGERVRLAPEGGA